MGGPACSLRPTDRSVREPGVVPSDACAYSIGILWLGLWRPGPGGRSDQQRPIPVEGRRHDVFSSAAYGWLGKLATYASQEREEGEDVSDVLGVELATVEVSDLPNYFDLKSCFTDFF